MKANAEWGFTAHPDFPRICRELASVGCSVGLVQKKGETPVTLIDMTAPGVAIPPGERSAAVAGTNGRWRVVGGDKVKQATGVRPVSVQGFTSNAILGAPKGPITSECTAAERKDLDQLTRLQRFAASHRDSLWTTGWMTVRVQAMSDSHLHYALTKAYRGEYPDSASRIAGIDALMAEAARRLLRTWGLDR